MSLEYVEKNNNLEQMALAELHYQAVQCMAVSLEIRRTWKATAAADIGRLTSIAKQMVSCAILLLYIG